MAKESDLDLTGHRSALTRGLLECADLTPGHDRRPQTQADERYPEFSGKIMLLGHWVDGGVSVSDPHRKSVDAYRQVFIQIQDACDRWSAKL